jgi:DNA-binding ferritin-like protein
MDMTLTLPDSLAERVTERAAELGYTSPDDYRLALLEADLDEEEEEITPQQIIADIK